MPLSRIAAAGAAYFGLVFGAGFVLGTLRVLWLVPHLGERRAELLETPFMLAVVVLAARWIVGHFALPPEARVRLAVGGAALALLLATELTLVLGLRGLTLEAYLAGRDPVSGSAYAASLGLFAAMPWLLSRRGGPPPRDRRRSPAG